jgi:GNAT superfamily N-acetyltransferase
MSPLIEVVDAPEALDAVSRLRAEVFEREWGISVEPAEPLAAGRGWHLVARLSQRGGIVGALTVLDVTGDERLLRSCNLAFADGMRVARYSHLAVARQHRGLGIALGLMSAARDRIIAPAGFDLSWLRLDAGRLDGSPLTSTLGFAVRSGLVVTPAGPCVVLARLETRNPHIDVRPELAA